MASGVDYPTLMHLLSRPRPNGSAANRATLRDLCAWLDQRAIPYALHDFGLYPYFFEAIGVWLLFSRILLAGAVFFHGGWLTLVIALVGLAGGALDVSRGWPLVTWPGRCQGRNLIITFEPVQAAQELVLSAHYDSKTELFDHQRRAFFQRHIRLGMALTVCLGLLSGLEGWLRMMNQDWARYDYGLALVLCAPMLGLAWGLGLNLALGRWGPQSAGAVDNGAACAILLGLAAHLAQAGPPLQRTRLFLVLFAGEEQNMQGSRAWVQSRLWQLPARALNLELMGQDGGYVLWQYDGNAFSRVRNAEAMNQAVSQVVASVSGEPPSWEELLNSDAFSFHQAGIPATTLGSRDRRWGLGGLHRPSDALARVAWPRLPEGVAILARFIRQMDAEPIA